ncbi:MAG: 16S rRNA (cytosine(1402)-N(4))-methyltransferase RsmH [Saprospiraceae bacterium]|nr:16S rRNA (cytosine(1402)-N(4))-methyltransferase RsmH [Saprospiraceae bacterium]
MSYHVPVLAGESIDALAIKPDGIYIDATFGGGGHSALILNALGDNGRLLGFDQDGDAAQNVPDDDRFTFVQHNFRFMKRFLRLYKVEKVDGILADLGVSSFQLDEGRRGFSYRFDTELDMRMNQGTGTTAATILQEYGEQDLVRVFSELGEVRNSKTLAARIVELRRDHPLQTIGDFLALLDPIIKGQRLRYLSQVFQALRIEVNDEMGALEDFLQQSMELLKPGGRLAIITYHSIEDRMVKRFMKAGNMSGEPEKDFYGNIHRPFDLISRKAILPEQEELHRNPRSRSAKLRVAALKEL